MFNSHLFNCLIYLLILLKLNFIFVIIYIVNLLAPTINFVFILIAIHAYINLSILISFLLILRFILSILNFHSVILKTVDLLVSYYSTLIIFNQLQPQFVFIKGSFVQLQFFIDFHVAKTRRFTFILKIVHHLTNLQIVIILLNYLIRFYAIYLILCIFIQFILYLFRLYQFLLVFAVNFVSTKLINFYTLKFSYSQILPISFYLVTNH